MPSPDLLSSRPRLLVVLWAVLLFIFALAIAHRHHHFPWYYHPDEPGKVSQILTGEWNFHHPMLLLTTTRLAVKLAGVPPEPQAIVEMGRSVSAFFTAVAVVALSLTAYLWRGWASAIIAGVALATHHQLFELSHYLKEDTALLAGISLAFLTSLWYAQAPSWQRALCLGLGCALAVSGKYLGIVALVVAIPALWQARPESRLAHFGLVAAAFLAMFALVNFPLVQDLLTRPTTGTLHQSLRREMNTVVHGQGDVTRGIPHALYWNVFLDNTNPVVWLLLLAFFTRTPARWPGELTVERLLSFFPVGFAIMLSFSPKENDRYFLPATAMFTLLASLGAAYAPNLCVRLLGFFGAHRPERLFTGAVRGGVTWSLAGLLWLLNLTGWSATKPGLARYDHAFVQDDIADLAAWMRENLPPDTTVVADARTGLQDPNRRKNTGRVSNVPQKLIIDKLAANKGTLDELRAQGVGYVVVSETSYGRFFREDLRAKDETDTHYLKAKAFYDRLLREGSPLFQRDRGTVIYLHPGMRVYRL